MSPGTAGAEVRSILLPFSTSAFIDLPADAVLESAYLFWSGSLAQDGVAGPKTADSTVTFTVPTFATYSVTAPAGACATVYHPTLGTQFPAFFYCRAEVTSLVAPNQVNGTYNGVYQVGDLTADPGHVDFNGQCTETPYPRCQAKYAAWSLVLIYRSETDTVQRDVHLYDGFMVVDHEDGATGSLGIASFTIDEFLADTTPQGTLSYFALESDAQLGLPPQNLYPVTSPEYCDTCQDYVKFNGTLLSGGNNPPGNVFNESLGAGSGVDIDSFEIGSLLAPGDTQATVEIGSGTGPVQATIPIHGGGELFAYGWTLLSLRRPAPNFKSAATNKTVNPTQAGQGETLAYTLNVANTGSLAANNTVVTDTLPALVSYTPDSLQINGVPCTDAVDGDPCSVNGQTLTVNLGTVRQTPGSNSRQISFMATVSPAALNGQQVCNEFQVVSTQTPTPYIPPPACFQVVAPELNPPTKVDLDVNGGVTGPDEVIQYTITLSTPGTGPISGLSFVDDMPPFLQLLTVNAPAGSTDTSSLNGGVNGRGQIQLSNISIPAGVSTVSFTFLAQVDSSAEFTAQGVSLDDIDGRLICNQGAVAAAFLPQNLLTDDPAQGGGTDPTCLTLTYSPILGTSQKTGVDLNGGQLEPGDVLRYTLSFINTGNRSATLTVLDDLPSYVTGFTLLTPVAGATFVPPPAGANSTGQLSIANLVVPAQTTQLVQFEVSVEALAPNQALVRNCVTYTVAEKASESATRCAPDFLVFATPELEDSRKTVTDLNGGTVQPGDMVRYTITVTNTGNRPATALVISDLVADGLTNVTPLDGGVLDAPTRTVTWTVGTLNQAEAVTVHFEAQVVTPTPNGTPLCNQAQVASAELPVEPTDDPGTAAVDDPTCVVVVSAPDLSITTKIVEDENGPPLRPGEQVRYTITVGNQGTEAATHLVVTDVVPAQLTAVVPLDGGAYDAGMGTVSWTVASLAPGEQRVLRFTAQVVTPLVNGTIISNQAFITADQIPAPGEPSDDPATPAVDDPTTITVTAAAILEGSSKTVVDVNGGVPQPGDVLQYTITLHNSGDAPARNTVVSDVIAAELTDIVPANGGLFDPTSRTITWPAAEVVPGTDLVLGFAAALVFPLANGTVVCNQATMTSQDLAAPALTDDPQTAAPSDPTCRTVESQPDLSPSTKVVEDLNGNAMEPGDILRYTITVENIGTQDATNVVVSDVVSPQLTTVVPQDGGVFDAATRTVTWTLPTVAAKGTAVVHFLAQVVLPLDDGTQIANQATIIATEIPTPVLTDDPATPATDDPTIITISAAPSFVTSSKLVVDENGGLVEPGDTLLYSLTVINEGTSLADQVVVRDILPAQVELVAVNQGGLYDAGSRTITWNSTTTPALAQVGLGQDGAVILTFAVRVNAPLPNGTEVCNQGQITSAELSAAQLTDNPQTPVPGDPTCLTVSSAPDLSGATKQVADLNGAPLRPGDNVSYTISVTNTGNSGAANVVITDVVDLNLINVVAGQGGIFNPGSRTITWNAATTAELAALEVGETITLSFSATVVLPLDNNTVISNQATVSSPDLVQPVLTDDPATPALDDPTQLTVVAAAQLDGSEKRVQDNNGGQVEPDDTLTYTLRVKNTGDALARTVVVTDTVDPSLTNIQVLDGGFYNSLTRVITWNVPEVGLTPAGDVQLRFTAQVVTPLAHGTVIANQGFIQLPGAGPVPTDDPTTAAPDDPTLVTVVSRPDLSAMTKRVIGAVNKKVAPGAVLTYLIEVPNNGSENAQNLVVTDMVDEKLEGIAPQNGGTYNSATRTITWTIPLLEVGQKMSLGFIAQVRADLKNGDTISNQAFASSLHIRGQVPSDDPDTTKLDDPTVVTVEAILLLEQFDKGVRDLNGGEVEPGDTLEYTLTVRNTGAAYAFGVAVHDPVPVAHLEEIVVGQGGSFDAQSGAITWNSSTTPELVKLQPGTEVVLSFTARVKVPTANGTLISNQALLQAEGAPGELSDDPSTAAPNDPTVVKVVSLPRFTDSTKTVTDLNGGQVKPGDVLEYTITVINNGTANAQGVRLIDPIPSYTSYVGGSTRLNGSPVPDDPGANPSPTASGISVSSPGSTPGVVKVGEEQAATVRFLVRVDLETQEGRIISNQGLIYSSTTPIIGTDDPRTPVKGDPTQVVVGSGPNLKGITKTYSPKPLHDNGNGHFDEGESIAYVVTIPNTGTAAAHQVVFTDPLDPNGRGVYLPGSLTLDGHALSDEADADAGSATSTGIRVVIGTIPAGKTAVIGYAMRIVSGPQVENQGTVRCTELQPELTDADGNDHNGDQITVVRIGDEVQRRLRGEKTVQDVNGGVVRSVDELLYSITIFNEGSVDENVDVLDHIPADVHYVDGSLVTSSGVSPTFDEPPQGDFGRGRLGFTFQVPAGATATALFRAVIDTDLPDGTSICNTATYGSDGGMDFLPPLGPACVLIGSPVGTGGLTGVVFRDIGPDNGQLEENDQRLPGFVVQAFTQGNPNSTPVASGVADEQGVYHLGSLPAGVYTLRILSARGVQMGTLAALTVKSGQSPEQNLIVDPTGLLYNSVTGEVVNGSQVALYYDDTDPLAPGALVPSTLVGQGQQGQITDATGFYRFDVQAGRAYQIKVQPLSSSLQWPSSLIPAQAEFAQVGPENEVVPDDRPDPKKEGARLTYYLRFKVQGKADQLHNNHLPVDPLSALIRLEKRADRHRASMGDLITYTITVENRSTRDFLADGQQVGIEDLLPRGLRLIRKTTHRIRRLGAGKTCLESERAVTDQDGTSACLSTAEPTMITGRLARFGPMPLGAGEVIRLVYQLAVGLDTRQGVYRNRAILRDASFGLDLSNSAEARILVEPDPDLDQGLLLGKVFCDADGNGRQGPGERGVPGVHVYLDNGTYAVTDSAGKYHLRNIDPGLHLLKMDVNTLPVGSQVTTDVSRVVQFTRGLPAKVNFGARCRENWVEVQQVKLKPKKKGAAKKKAAKLVVPGLSLAGDVAALRLSVNGQPVPLLDLDLALTRGGRTKPLGAPWDNLPLLDVPYNQRGQLAVPLIFNLQVQGPKKTIRGWRLEVRQPGEQGREVVRRFSGQGSPPAQLAWPGTVGQKLVLKPGRIYEAQLEVVTEDGGGATSPRRYLTAGWPHRRRPPKPHAGLNEVFLDGAQLPLDEKQRFSTLVGQPEGKPLLLELRRGDGQSAWKKVGASAPPPPQGPGSSQVEVKGNLKQGQVQVAGYTLDASLLSLELKAVPADGLLNSISRDGRLKTPLELKPIVPPIQINRWKIQLTDRRSKAQRTIQGSGPLAVSVLWDGTDDQGQGMITPEGAYLARLIIEDTQGNVGQSAPLELKVPAAPPYPPLTLQRPSLFHPKSGKLLGPARIALHRAMAGLKRRPASERYRVVIQVAPPLTWEPDRWGFLLKAVERQTVSLLARWGLPPFRYAITVQALPLPSTPLVPKKRRGRAAQAPREESLSLEAIVPLPVTPPHDAARVLVDGTSIPLHKDATFQARVKGSWGTVLVLELRDGSGRRALYLVPVKTPPFLPGPTKTKSKKKKGQAPESHIELLTSERVGAGGDPGHPEETTSSRTYLLRMREGGSLTLRLAQADAQPRAGKAPTTAGDSTEVAPPASQPASAGQQAAGAPSVTGKPASGTGSTGAVSLPSAPAAAPSSAVTAPQKAAPAEQGAFGAEVLHQAFGAPASADKAQQQGAKVPAAQLAVDLPPRGAVLKSTSLTLRGRSHPQNKVTINGAKVELQEDGSFTHTVKLPEGKSELTIRATDAAGNQGEIRWPVKVTDRALFLMAMAEGAIGQVGAELDGDTDHSRLEAGPVMLHGRTVLYLKGRIKGKYLFKQYLVTAHVDTAKQREFEEFFDQVIDPNRYYPVYGDSAEEVRDVNARDKYYLLVEADRSSLLVGNFTAGIKGIELLSYDRTLYGARVDLDKTFFKGKMRQQAKVFISRDDARLSRDHNVLRATGGSIYYLRHGEVLVGSERIKIVVRERDTGLLLTTIPQSRDMDYVIDYAGGRILFKSPVSSVADASFTVSNLTSTLSTLAGHPVYIEIDYEYERNEDQGSGAWGVQVKNTLFDILTLGATYVREDRAAEVGESYQLYGGELTVRHGKASTLTVEVARSESFDAQNFISEDGGLTYLSMNHIALWSADERAQDANAYKIASQLELSDFFKAIKPETFKLQGYLSQQDRGFFSQGTILEQGRTKFGGTAEWSLTRQDRLTLRHDGAIALLPQMPYGNPSVDPLAFRELETELTRLRYELKRGRLSLASEYAHSFMRDPLLDGTDSNRDSVGVLGSFQLNKRWRFTLGQDAIIYASGNDPQLGTGALSLAPSETGRWQDRMMTTAGVAFRVSKELEIEVAESVRWSGDNATSAGLRAKISPTASIYARQQLGHIADRLSTTTVLGAEDRFGKGGTGRTYGEYQIERSVLGLQNRAILGLAQKWTPWRGISFSGGYEHQQVFGGNLPDGTPTGSGQRDVVHLGFEFLRLRTLKLSTRAELRYDNGGGILGLMPGQPSELLAANVDSRAGLGKGYYGDRLVTPGSQLILTPGERWQMVSRNAASWAATKDLTFLGRVNLYRTYNRTEGKVEAQAIELGVGAALRPVAWDILNIIFKYTRLLEMRPLSLTEDLAQWRTLDVISLIPILELPFNFQLVEKLAYKRVFEENDLLADTTLSTVIHTLLWINRLNFHLTARLDAGVEYRFQKMILADQGDQLRHGALVELGYWIHEYVRLGAGYNFSRFSDNEFADQDRDAGGFFFRVVGRY